jgi:hypothetical protein
MLAILTDAEPLEELYPAPTKESSMWIRVVTMEAMKLR